MVRFHEWMLNLRHPKPDKLNKRTFAYFQATKSLSPIGTVGIAFSCKSKAARRRSVC